jgi:RNA polymerase sigma-70 factor (ECF subfamily)
MQRVCAGDQEAFRGLIGRYANGVKTHIFRLVRVEQRAEELAQQVFFRLFLNRASYAEEYEASRTIEHLLFRMATNAAYNELRRHAREAELVEEYARLQSPPQQPDAALLAAELKEQINDALARLPPMFRKTVELHYFEDDSDEEVARKTGVNVSTVRTRLSRARQLLKKTLTNYVKGSGK